MDSNSHLLPVGFIKADSLRQQSLITMSTSFVDPISSNPFMIDIIPDAYVFGQDYPAAAIAGDGHINVILESGDYDPWVRQWASAALSQLTTFQHTTTVDEACCISLPLNFCHWHQESLPKICILERTGFKGKYIIADYSLFVNSLIMCGISRDRIHVSNGEVIKVRKLFSPQQYPISNNSLYPAALMFARDRCLQGAETSTRFERIFIDRSASIRRSLVDREEFDHLLSSFGFHAVLMEALTLPQQIGLAASAKVVLGPHGAGMASSLFMQRHGRVFELFSPLYINTCLIPICRLLDLDYFPVVSNVNPVGTYPHGENISPNMNVLRYFLEKHL